MNALLESLQIAISDTASDDERRNGARTCRALADALEGAIAPNDPSRPAILEFAGPPELEPILPEPMTLAPLLSAGHLENNPFAVMTADQILELVITKLRGTLGEDAPPPPAGPPFRVNLVTVPRIR